MAVIDLKSYYACVKNWNMRYLFSKLRIVSNCRPYHEDSKKKKM